LASKIIEIVTDIEQQGFNPRADSGYKGSRAGRGSLEADPVNDSQLTGCPSDGGELDVESHWRAPDREHNTALVAPDAVLRARRTYRQRPRRVATVLIELRTGKHQDMFVTVMFVARQSGARCVSQERRGGSRGPIATNSVDFYACAKWKPINIAVERVG